MFRELVRMPGNATLEPIVDMIATVSISHEFEKGTHTRFHLIGSLTPRLPPAKLDTFHVGSSPSGAIDALDCPSSLLGQSKASCALHHSLPAPPPL